MPLWLKEIAKEFRNELVVGSLGVTSLGGFVLGKLKILGPDISAILISNIALSITLLIGSLFYYLGWLRAKNKFKILESSSNLKANFNILWDSAFQPYCPICETLLQQPPTSTNLAVLQNAVKSITQLSKPKLSCKKCKEDFSLVDTDGYQVSFEEAVVKLRGNV